MGCKYGREAGVDCEGLLWWQGPGVMPVHVHLSDGVCNALSFPFFFLFSDFNQEQMCEQANELEPSETTVRAEV